MDIKFTFNRLCTSTISSRSISAGNSLPRATFTPEILIVGPYSSSPTCSSFCEIAIVILGGALAVSLCQKRSSPVCMVMNKLPAHPPVFILTPSQRPTSSVSIILIQLLHRILRLYDLLLLPHACISISLKGMFID